jgi:hypothetical protein
MRIPFAGICEAGLAAGLFGTENTAMNEEPTPEPPDTEDSGSACSRCACKEFVSGLLSSVICTCGHDTKAHGMPF